MSYPVACIHAEYGQYCECMEVIAECSKFENLSSTIQCPFVGRHPNYHESIGVFCKHFVYRKPKIYQIKAGDIVVAEFDERYDIGAKIDAEAELKNLQNCTLVEVD